MTCPNYSTCKHAGRCDGVPGDDCYEPRLDTDRCPPPDHIEFSDGVTLVDAYAQIRRSMPMPSSTCFRATLRQRVKLSGVFTRTLERARAMRVANV